MTTTSPSKDIAATPSNVTQLPGKPIDAAETLIAKAIEHKVSIESLERLLAMRKELKSEQAQEAFYRALSAFQSECPIISKTATATVQTRQGGQYQYNYAPLDVIAAQIQPLLKTHGLSFTIQTKLVNDPLSQVARCTVHHVDGHSESSEFQAPIDAGAKMNEMQKSASAQTYAKRYALCNALGILTGDGDDDGRGAGADDQPDNQTGGNKPQPKTVRYISEAQIRRLYALMSKEGLDEDYVRQRLNKAIHTPHFSEIPQGASYKAICEKLPKWKEQQADWLAKYGNNGKPDLPDHLVDHWTDLQDILKEHGKQGAEDSVKNALDMSDADKQLLLDKLQGVAS